MNGNFDWRKMSCVLIITGCVQFIIVTFVAMFFYKGGTYINPNSSGYIFCFNYFSDLGRTVAHSGIANKISFILFTVTFTLWGILQIPFYFVFPTFFKDSIKFKKFSKIGSIFGCVSGVFYVGVAFTPSDIMSYFHNIFVVISFSSIYFSLIVYAIVIFRSKFYPNFYALILLISVIIISIYFIFLGLFANGLSSIDLLIYVVGQKVMIYTLLINGIIQGCGALRQLAP